MKYIPVIMIIGVLVFGGFILADLGSKVIENQHNIIKTRLLELDK